MNLRTEWYLLKTARASQVEPTKSAGKTGIVAALWGVITYEPGLWFGWQPVEGIGAGLGALTIDTDIAGVVKAQQIKDALKGAPDPTVFDMREPVTGPAANWQRRTAFFTSLESRLIDTGGKLSSSGKTVRYLLREVLRTCAFYRFLGRNFHPLPLSAKLEALSAAGRQALADHLVEHGYPSAKVPDKTKTFRQFYREALEDPLTDFGLDAGHFHLGRHEANLKRGG